MVLLQSGASLRKYGGSFVCWLLVDYPCTVQNMHTMNREKQVWSSLKTVIDPELNIDIVSLGLVYSVTETMKQTETGSTTLIHIVMTLTTPGCPLIHIFESKIREALQSIPDLDVYRQVSIELTFDPPWIPDMMDPAARAELGI